MVLRNKKTTALTFSQETKNAINHEIQHNKIFRIKSKPVNTLLSISVGFNYVLRRISPGGRRQTRRIKVKHILANPR